MTDPSEIDASDSEDSLAALGSNFPFYHEPRWWQGVRLRFGVLLALALLPWLLLTTLEAISTVNRDQATQSQLNEIISMHAVEEVGRIIEAGRLGLDAAPQIISEVGCEAGAVEILDRLNVYTALIVQDADGSPICQSPTFSETLLIENPRPFSATNPFQIKSGRLEGDSGAQDVVILQSRVRSTGQTYILVLSAGMDQQNILDSAFGAGNRLAITKSDGRVILGHGDEIKNFNHFSDRIADYRNGTFDYVTQDGSARRVSVRYFEDLDVYVSVGHSAAAAGDIWTGLRPYSSIVLPILAWMIGFGLIWLGTQTMLLTPIYKTRLAIRQFARGKRWSHVALSGSAATEMQGLADSFNSMVVQLKEREARLADNLDEKDILMREIHHRVKNNLQIIISLLNMQERKADTEEAIRAIADTRTRINAIAIVHRGLYESEDLRKIEIAPFISRLVHAMEVSLGTEDEGIRLSHSVDPCRLLADQAIPTALFIVEAISNAVKHGVDRGGVVHIELSCLDNRQIQIEVSDNGRGVGDPQSMKGIGTRLMHGFARQLSGSLTFYDNQPGLGARLILTIDESEEQPFQLSRKDS